MKKLEKSFEELLEFKDLEIKKLKDEISILKTRECFCCTIPNEYQTEQDTKIDL
jgi:hypothetical protein